MPTMRMEMVRNEEGSRTQTGNLPEPEMQEPILEQTKAQPSLGILQCQAQRAVWLATKTGKLKRPEQCERCNRPCRPDAHHYLGYAKEHWLDVHFLCRRCHTLAHGNIPKDMKQQVKEYRVWMTSPACPA